MINYMKILSKLKDFLKSKKFKELEEENRELKHKLAIVTATMEHKLAIVTVTMEHHKLFEQEWAKLAMELSEKVKCNL